jgi:hypothetical protein
VKIIKKFKHQKTNHKKIPMTEIQNSKQIEKCETSVIDCNVYIIGFCILDTLPC